MHQPQFLAEFVLLLAASICLVPLFSFLRLSPILGYMAAGVLLGPYAGNFIGNESNIHALAELGVIFLLFIIGLELSFERLKRMRGRVLGFGLSQVMLCSVVLALVARAAGLSAEACILVGGGLALSSTAIVMELLNEGMDKNSKTGRLAVATLILQDLAVIPLLVMVPLLASEGSLAYALGMASLRAAVGLVVIMMAGRLLLRPLFRLIAASNHHELFTATALLVVMAMAYISTLAGLSPALGAFMGGLLVAETEFKLQVEADILPFKGLFLGMFFITIGMGIDLELVMNSAATVFGLAFAIMFVKALTMLALGMVFGMRYGPVAHVSLLLAQGGEFAFVLFALANSFGVLDSATTQMLTAAVTLSLIFTPPLHRLGQLVERYFDRRGENVTPLPAQEITEIQDHVIIAGFGRVGRTVAQLLEEEGIPYIALDMDAATVGGAREAGKMIYYGDSSRGIVLKTVGITRARAVIITHSDTRIAAQAITSVRKFSTTMPIIVRAKNIGQVLQLEAAGATLALAEMFETSLQLGGALLRALGTPDLEISRVLEEFRASDYELTRRAESQTTERLAIHNPTGNYTI